MKLNSQLFYDTDFTIRLLESRELLGMDRYSSGELFRFSKERPTEELRLDLNTAAERLSTFSFHCFLSRFPRCFFFLPN